MPYGPKQHTYIRTYMHTYVKTCYIFESVFYSTSVSYFYFHAPCTVCIRMYACMDGWLDGWMSLLKSLLSLKLRDQGHTHTQYQLQIARPRVALVRFARISSRRITTNKDKPGLLSALVWKLLVVKAVYPKPVLSTDTPKPRLEVSCRKRCFSIRA